ncbi:hypothetical protein [Thauera sp. 2A1]|uniref:hypothetical protein n=1 Tax=Thauera sp. 2A1 TaxID=2570191 RepID=UPI0012918BBB|nr:hypothetical protein [Thauera sp. 2A1]KAI5915990.1 hypothetical protein GH664_06155 [Thauera sp. 2A1]
MVVVLKQKTQPASNADWVALALAEFIERPQAVGSNQRYRAKVAPCPGKVKPPA